MTSLLKTIKSLQKDYSSDLPLITGKRLPLLCDSLLGKCDTTLLDKKDK